VTLHGLFPRIFVLGPPAPPIAHAFGVQLRKSLPYVDYLICNEAEAKVWVSASGLPVPKILPPSSGLSPNNRHPIPPATACCQFYLIEFTALRTSRSAGPLKDSRFGSSLPTFGIDGEILSFVPRDEYLLTMGL